MPLRAHAGGILTRRGHTEAGVDLCKLTGLPEAGVLCELVNDLNEDENGGMMRRDECRAFTDRWGLKMISVEQLVEPLPLLPLLRLKPAPATATATA